MNNLSAAIYMTAQGIPFLQAGEEMLRTKIDASGGFVENSYNSPDSVNSIKWDTLEAAASVFTSPASVVLAVASALFALSALEASLPHPANKVAVIAVASITDKTFLFMSFPPVYFLHICIVQ